MFPLHRQLQKGEATNLSGLQVAGGSVVFVCSVQAPELQVSVITVVERAWVVDGGGAARGCRAAAWLEDGDGPVFAAFL